MTPALAAIVAKAEAARSMHPFLWGALLVAGGVLLAASAFQPRTPA